MTITSNCIKNNTVIYYLKLSTLQKTTLWYNNFKL